MIFLNTFVNYENLRILKSKLYCTKFCFSVDGSNFDDFSLPEKDLWDALYTEGDHCPWNTPEKVYLEFIALLDKDLDYKNKKIWFFPPQWQTKQQKRIHLEDNILQLSTEITQKSLLLEKECQKLRKLNFEL